MKLIAVLLTIIVWSEKTGEFDAYDVVFAGLLTMIAYL